MFKPVVFLCLAAVALAKKKEMKPAAVPLTAAGRAIGGRFQDAIQTLQYMECLQTCCNANFASITSCTIEASTFTCHQMFWDWGSINTAMQKKFCELLFGKTTTIVG